MNRRLTVLCLVSLLLALSVPAHGEAIIGKSFYSYLPDDNWFGSHGWYVVGIYDDTEYWLDKYDASEGWILVHQATVNAGEIHTMMEGNDPFTNYRLVSTRPIQSMVTSAEGQSVGLASTSGRYIGKDFVCLAGYRDAFSEAAIRIWGSSDEGYYAGVVFGLYDNTNVTITLYKDDNGNDQYEPSIDQTVLYGPTTGLIDKGEHLTALTNAGGSSTAFWKITADRDVLASRTSIDGDELDWAVSDNGRLFGKTFYYTGMHGRFPLGFRLRNLEDEEATVRIYDVLDPDDIRLMWEGTVQSYDLTSVPNMTFRHEALGDGLSYAKVVSNKNITVIAGFNHMRGDFYFAVPSQYGLQQSYLTNMVYGGGDNGLRTADHNSPIFNEFVGVDKSASRITVDPPLPADDKTLEYISSSPLNKIFYEKDGIEYGLALEDTGINEIAFPEGNTVLTGFLVQSGSSIIWGAPGGPLGGTFSSSRWKFYSDSRFLFYQGGNGNCWVKAATSPVPNIEIDQIVTESFDGYHFVIRVLCFGPEDVTNAVLTDQITANGLSYVPGTFKLNGEKVTPFQSGSSTLVYALGTMTGGSPTSPVEKVISFDAVSDEPDVEITGQSEVTLTYNYWDPYWNTTDSILEDIEDFEFYVSDIDYPKPVTGLMATPNPDGSITLTWTKSISEDTAVYNIYMSSIVNSISQIDFDNPTATIDHPGESWTSDSGPAAGQLYRFCVRTENQSGIEEKSNTIVSAVPYGNESDDVYAVIISPGAGSRILYEEALIKAEIVPADGLSEVEEVLFEYREFFPSGEETSWTAMAAKRPQHHPNPDQTPNEDGYYFIHWDIQGINNDPVKTGTYELRAVVNGLQSDDIPTIVVDVVDHNPDVVEGDNISGEHVRQEMVYNDRDNDLLCQDDESDRYVEVTLPAGALEDSETVISLIIADEDRFLNTVPEDLESIGEFCEINLSNDQHELANGKTVCIRISYEDDNGDGIVDGTDVSTSDLSIYYYNEESGDWEEIETVQWNSTSCWVEAEVNHLSTFGLMGSSAAPQEIETVSIDPDPVPVPNNSVPAAVQEPVDNVIVAGSAEVVVGGGGGGGGSCFISTAASTSN